MPDADWALHGIVLGVLAAIGAVVTLIAYVAPSRGGILELGPVVAFFLWIGLGIYAVASTITFAAFRKDWGVFPCYIAALPLPAVPLLVLRGRDWFSLRRSDRKQQAELVSRFELVSWSHRITEPGRLRLDSEIRALKDLEVQFEGHGMCAAGYAVTSVPKDLKKVRVAAGGTTRLSVVLEFTPDVPPPVRPVLQFITWAEDPHDGITVYEKVDRDLGGGEWCVRRPLPPERPPV
ncbi:MAG: hypothetical protein EHM91_16290 [Planctomycetota bacterium]|nr:MAG: hypothetical protein EHM91_16290 [Planctomycetota bacterium]